MAVAAFVVGTTPAAADDRQVLESLAKRYWAAEVEQDYGTVYTMLSPGMRDTMTRDEYVTFRKEVGPARYTDAEVGEIAVAGDLAWVHVKARWGLPKFPNAGARPGAMWQLWRRTDGWTPVPLDEREQWPILPPHLRPAADEAALLQRVTGMWKAKAEQDWKGVYGYMPPWYRERMPLEKFLRNKARFLYVSHRVEWVEVEGDDARARIAIAYKFNDPAATKMPPREESLIEPWAKVDGNWYLKAGLPEEPEAAAKEKTN